MADFNALEALINAHIKKNGVQAITGNILNGILRGMVAALGKGYTIAGSASPATDPGTMTGPLAYIAYTAGTYTHFGGLEVEQGEVAMLIYNEAEWHKEVLFSLAASATIDGNVGTPEVGVSFVDGQLTFDFRNMKGNPGDPAGFGTVNATVDDQIGTPSVSVQSSGPDTAKNFTFAFHNLKGETGVTSVVATVDNTSGTPSCAVSLQGQQLTLAFTGLKGAQGNTGVSADYPIAIINNLTTDDPASALSAAQGVVLDGKVSQLEAKVGNIEAVTTENDAEEIVILDNDDTEVLKVTEDGLSAKSLKVGTTPVLTENDKLQAGENITINGNVISADSPFEKEDASSLNEEQVWADDEGTETYAKVDKNGVHAKEYFDLEGNTLKEKIEAAIDEKYDNEVARVCNTKYNHSALARFINKYVAKDVDEWNQLTLMMCGDSIFGRQHLGATEISPTLDVNTHGSTDIGYDTGHFPPNMWVQNVPFKVLQALQFDGADVKYFNHIANEVTKTGSGWTDMFPCGADELRTIKTNTLGDSITLHFTGSYFSKVVLSNYSQTSHLANVKVTVSENGGAFVTPGQLGLEESHEHTNSGEYELRDIEDMKFAQLVFAGFDPSKSYDLKVELTNGEYINVWGFETWTRKRLNVVVTAHGGSVAYSQLVHPKRFYNENLRPELCIMNMPFLNDCGSAYWNVWYKGKKVPTSAAIASPSQYDFIYCDEAGTYTNYGGIEAVKGDYIEYNGSSWVLGSTKINNMFNAYRKDLKKLMAMCKNIGVPMLVLVTHQSSVFIGKPFLDDAATFMKLNAKEVGFAAIDVYKYRKDLNLANIWSDGTHLNNNGVKMYIDLITEVLNKDSEYVADGRAVIETGSFAGHTNGGNTSFGFIMKETPKVFLSNPSVSVTSVSKTGFNVSGSGSYDYYVKS